MIFSLILLFALPAEAAIRAVATTPDVAWLLKQVGGNRVEVKTLARPNDNYHFLDARPDYILAVSRAAIVCRVGADLEIGWLPKVLDKAANRKVMPGGSGDCDLSRDLHLLEQAAAPVDRSMGDAHGKGNPHFWLSPAFLAEAAKEVEKRLQAADPAGAEEFAANRAAVEKELQQTEKTVKEKLKPLAGSAGAYQYHKDFSYFLYAYGIRNLGSIEEVPGVAPSAARLGNVALEAKEKKAALALASPHDPSALLAKFAEVSGVKVKTVPTSLSSPDERSAYRSWQESVASTLLEK